MSPEPDDSSDEAGGISYSDLPESSDAEPETDEGENDTSGETAPDGEPTEADDEPIEEDSESVEAETESAGSIDDVETLVVSPDDVYGAMWHNGDPSERVKGKAVFIVSPPFDEEMEPPIEYLEELDEPDEETIRIRPFRFIMEGRQVLDQRPSRALAKKELGEDDEEDTEGEEADAPEEPDPLSDEGDNPFDGEGTDHFPFPTGPDDDEDDEESDEEEKEVIPDDADYTEEDIEAWIAAATEEWESHIRENLTDQVDIYTSHGMHFLSVRYES